MHPYIPHTPEDVKAMLSVLGMEDAAELFSDIPEHLRLQGDLAMPQGLAEHDVMKKLRQLAEKNRSAYDYVSFLGAGCYDHMIPAVIDHILSRSEYYTSYTPYQAEISQGTLHYIFEFQTMIANLTGMDVANASVYDGGTGAAEALLMVTGANRRKKVLVSEVIAPQTKAILNTYLPLHGVEMVWIPATDGQTDLQALKSEMAADVSAVFMQNPNFYGILEEVEEAAAIAHEVKKTAMVLSVDPISLGVLKRPGDQGVDVVIGEGQGLGIPQAYGGPFLGIMACKKEYMRKLPGRIVGETVDLDGKRSYVLTLTAREQHIRREKATSNICSNQGLNVLAATIYLALLGPEGLREVASQSMQKAHYACRRMVETGKVKLKFNKPFFKEFLVEHTEDVHHWEERATEAGYLAGVPMSYFDENLKDTVLYAVTEKRTKADIDGLVALLEVQA